MTTTDRQTSATAAAATAAVGIQTPLYGTDRLELLAAIGAMEAATTEISALRSKVAELQTQVQTLQSAASTNIHDLRRRMSQYQAQFGLLISKAILLPLEFPRDALPHSAVDMASGMLRAITGVDAVSVVGLIPHNQETEVSIGRHQMTCVASLVSSTQASVQLSNVRSVRGGKSAARIAVVPPDSVGAMETWILLKPNGDPTQLKFTADLSKLSTEQVKAMSKSLFLVAVVD